uniref:C-signal-like isoform X2 n=1 Tax=Myxine glutinosa TaxID=7769 RepID=UPI00358E4622
MCSCRRVSPQARSVDQSATWSGPRCCAICPDLPALPSAWTFSPFQPFLPAIPFSYVTDEQSIATMANKVEGMVGKTGLDLLVNSAAVLERGSLSSVSSQGMNHTFQTNVVGPLLITKALLPLLHLATKEHPPGSPGVAIVNISGILGSMEEISKNNDSMGYSYPISKAALNMLTRCLMIDLKDTGILTVALHPGWVRTDMGGPKARISVEESVAQLCTVISSLSSADNGAFLDFRRKLLPW